jgi:osmotically-inducible protein OsmY
MVWMFFVTFLSMMYLFGGRVKKPLTFPVQKNNFFMKLNRLFGSLLLASALMVLAPSCKKKPTDAELKAKVEAAVAAMPGLIVDVKDGVANISGQVADDAAKSAAEAAVKAVEGISSVTNSLTVTPPPPPVVINPDQTLIDGVKTALAAFSTVKADVKDGVVTLTGDLKKSDLATVMAAVNSLKPKKVVNQITVKK